jgi:hypothetical protein
MPPFVLLAGDFFAEDFLAADFLAEAFFPADFLELDFFAGIESSSLILTHRAQTLLHNRHLQP